MATDHEITYVKQDTQLSSTEQGFRPVFKVGYQVTDGPAKGTAGHIIVPADQYNAETVKATLAKVVGTHQEVHKI